MPVIGEIVRDLPIFKEVHSILEFGSDDGETYRIVHPDFYYGVDRDPKWFGNKVSAFVSHVDIREWWSGDVLYDLVICDAHGAVDDPTIREVTESQVALAQNHVKPGGLIVVDDCWLVEIGRTALKELGQPTQIAVERPGFWIWQR